MPRPALAALAEQQKTIQAQAALIEQQEKALTNLTRVARAQQNQIIQLGHGLQTIAQLGGIEQQFHTAMRRVADAQNPAQPVPEPPAVPPVETTQDAKTPEAMADVQSPGLVPGTTNDVAADAVTTAYTPGQDVPGTAFNNLQDVTAPVDGTQNPRPLSEVKTLTDVRVGDPMNPQTGFPLRGPFQNAQRTSSVQDLPGDDPSRRTMASIRLARLRIAAGMSEGTEDLAVAAQIEKDASLSLESIEREIVTLDAVKTASLNRQQPAAGRNPSLVPRTARQRAVPSMQGGGHSSSITATAAVSDDDEALFD